MQPSGPVSRPSAPGPPSRPSSPPSTPPWAHLTRASGSNERMFPGSTTGSADRLELPLELVHLVAQARRFLEAEPLRGLVHLLLEALDEPAELVGRHALEVGEDCAAPPAAPAAPPAAAARAGAGVVGVAQADHLED